MNNKMNNNLVSTFTNILKTAVVLQWDEHDISRLICCLLKSTTKSTRLSSNDIHKILNDSNNVKAPVLTALVKGNIVSSPVTLQWILQMDYNNMMQMLDKCFEEDTYTVLGKYSNSILDSLVNYLHDHKLQWKDTQKIEFMSLISSHHQIDSTKDYCNVFYHLMQSYKVHVLAVLKHNKEFILDLKGSKSQLKDLCVDQLNVREEDFNDIIKVMENGECYESDADSDGDLKSFISSNEDASLSNSSQIQDTFHSPDIVENLKGMKRKRLVHSDNDTSSTNDDDESNCSSNNSYACFGL